MYRVPFGDKEYYHIFNRGAHKSELFKNSRDYFRFLSNIYNFNDANFNPQNYKYEESKNVVTQKEKRMEIVDIIAWCLMPNHYHLLLRQKNEKGITKFMRRLGTGFTMYINIKYKHSGHIFEGPFKYKHINHDTQLQHLTRYIHLNPLDIYDPNWRRKGTRNTEDSKNFILNYQWSSLNDYLGNKKYHHLLSPVTKEIVFTQKPKRYIEFLCEWMIKGIPNSLDIAEFE